MSFTEFLTSEPVITLAATGVAAFWTAMKSSEWWQRSRSRRYHRAIEALEAGVDKTYRSYVKAIKEARADGKLTDAERQRARQIARETAITYGRNEGIDVIREVGDDYLDLWLSRLVRKAKGLG
jgi:N-glycosylase/DNA lyase